MNNMNESKFVDKLVIKLEGNLPNKYETIKGGNLIYKVIIDYNLQFHPRNPKNPSRGVMAFQTDILIKDKERGLPLVVIEVKYGGFSTHDVLIYSTKATKHKEIYPYLRYGFVVGGQNILQNRFFIHNTGIDFALAVDDKNNLNNLVSIVKKQIDDANKLIKIMQNKNQIKGYISNVEII